MADGGISLEILLNDLKFTAGMLRAAASQKQFTGEVDKTKAQAAKAEKELDRMAESVKKMTATPLEKYNAELNKLNMLQSKGKLTAEEHRRAVAMTHAEYQKLTTVTTATRSTGVMSAKDMANSLGLVTTAAGAAQMAVSLISAAWADANEKIREAKQLLSDLEDPLIELNQVSASTYQFKQRASRIDAAAAKEGVPVKEAAKVFLDAVGADAEGDFETILASRRGVMKPSDAGTVVSKMTGLFKGQVGAKEAIDLVLAASASEGTKDTVTNVVQGIPKAAMGGSALGASPSATLATLTSLSDAMGGNATMAGDRMQAFGIKMKLNGYQGSPVDVMAKIRALPADKRAELLGNDQEINVAYDLLNKNEKLIRARTAEADKALADSRAGAGMGQQKKAQWEANPDTAAIQKAAEAQVARDVALKQTQGVRGAKQSALLNEIDTTMMRAGAPLSAQFGANLMAGFYARIGLPDNAVRYLSGASNAEKHFGNRRQAQQNGGEGIERAAGKLEAAADKINKAADNTKHRALNAEAMQPIN